MNDPQRLREISWRRRLTADEQAGLRASLSSKPEALEDLELESALTESLARLPGAPVSSNFTARVLESVEREASAGARRKPGQRWQVLFPRIAYAVSGVLTIVAVLSLLSYHQRAEARQMAQSVAAVSSVTSLPSPDVLRDFEAIRSLNSTPAPDEQLLALFK
jgi:hypothetical protein